MKHFFCVFVVLVFIFLPLYSGAPPEGNFKEIALDVTSMGKTIILPTDSMVVLRLKFHPSTGHQWEVINASRLMGVVRELKGSPYGPSTPETEEHLNGEKLPPGATHTQILRLVGEKKGIAEVTLALRRPWEGGQSKLLRFNIHSMGKFAGSFTPRKAVDDKASRLAADEVYAPGLPAHWDWREQNGVTPVRDQMNCNSCWAFGTIGATEGVLLIKDGISHDLSEQYIVDCNDDGFSCGGGGWWGHDYHWFKVIPGIAGAGVRYESEYPYANADTPCVDKTPHEQIEGWAYTDDVPDSAWPTMDHMVTTAELKQKIYDYGPVGTDVCSSTWGTYYGGVFTSHCSPGTHIVTVTGWDDYDGAFYIKNSWGTGWGESGYMRLAYNTCLVGDCSTYLLYGKTNPRIIYRAGVFNEDKANNGSIANSPIELRIEDSTSSTRFSRSSGNFIQGSEFTVSNLPSNLSMTIQATSNTTAVMSLSGNAINHGDVNDVSNLTVSFQNAAFTGGSAAAVENATFSNLNINFFDPYQLIYYQEPTITYINYANPWQFYWLEGSNYSHSFGLWWYDSVNEPDPNNNQCLKYETYTKPALSKSMTLPPDLRALNSGDQIGPNQQYWANGGSYGDQHTLAGPAHHDFKGGEHFVGFTFTFNGYPVYGWMRFNVSSDGSWGYLVDYAWQQDPNKTIDAGQTQDSGGGAPVASFSGNPTTVSPGSYVYFSDQSSNSPTSWSWSFPGGNPSSSSSQNPTVYYSNTGSYNVSLSVSNSYGSDSITQYGYITVQSTGQAPVANFSGSPTTVNEGGSVSFSDQSTGSPTSWSWSFPGGSPSSSSSQNPNVTYNNAGSYNVTLTVSNSYGSDSETKYGYISVGSGPITYCSSNGNDTSYEWIAGVQVGSLSNSSSASSGGYADYTSQTANLTPGSSVSVSLTPGFGSSSYTEYWSIWIDYNQNGSFDDSGEQEFTGSGSSTVSGSFSVSSSASGSTRMRVSMKYNAAPTSCESFTYGEVEDYTASFGSTPNPPVADFSGSPTTVTEGESVQFTNQSSGSPTSFSWSFPGGSPSSSSSQNPNVTYNNQGTYNVSLTVSNSYGSDTETKSGYITVEQAGSAPVANFTANPTTVTEGDSVQFTNQSSGSPTSFSWSFPGGYPSSSSSQNPSVTYNNEGSYNVSLTVSNYYGSDTETKYGYITVEQAGSPPVANFTGSPTTVEEGGTVQFTNTSSGSPTSFSWSFPGGNPSSSSSQNPSVTYNNQGTYNVTLTVSNNYGSDSETKNGYITVTGGSSGYCTSYGENNSTHWNASITVGSFSHSTGAESGGYGNYTSMTANLTPGSNVSVSLSPSTSSTRKYWRIWIDFNQDGDFEDSGEQVVSRRSYSTTSTDFDVPSSASGTTRMRVSMRTSSYPTPCQVFSTGEVQDYTVSFGGSPNPPVADFSGSPTSVDEGDSVQFTNQSSGNPTSFSWSFPGGSPSSSSSQNPNVTYNNSGTYNVTLSVSNSYGSDTETKYGYITVSQSGSAPVADFIGSPTTVNEGGTVQFTNTSSGSPSSFSWSFPGGSPSSSSSQNPSVTYNNAGSYNVTLSVSNSYGSDTETKYGYITVNQDTVSYCSSNGNSTTYEWIAGVQVGSFYNTSGAGSGGYTDFTSQTISLSPGSSTYVYLTPGFSSSSYTEYWMIWIDYNRNGSFDDSGENVFSDSGSSTVSGSFNVSSSASGSTRMRVSMRYYNTPSSCGSFDYGEVEDYTVSF